jgi:flagellar hook-associated protein 2
MASSTMRLSGLISGMDTESIIQQLVSAKQTKVDDAKKAQTKLEWKTTAWKDLNTKLKNLQSKYVNNMRFTSAYMKKTTSVSDSTAASVITGENAMNGVQNLKITQLAKTAYMTGGKTSLRTKTDADGDDFKLNALTKLSDLSVDNKGTALNLSTGTTLNIKSGDTNVELEITADTTISNVLTKLKEAGLNANFDETQQRFYISAKDSGKGNDFSITASDEIGNNVLKSLGLDSASANKIDAQNAKITLNDTEYESNTNVFSINGLTITAMKETAENVVVTTKDDVDGIYDMIKSFLKDYNSIINEMDKLYNADSARGYEPLTDDEKDAMSDSEVEKYEQKIKDALLRRDSNLSTVSSALKEIMAGSVEVNGKNMYLSDFGIETLSYFTAAENEKNAYHINGDADDSSTSGNADKLKSMISSDPDTVVSFFSGLFKNLYTKMSDLSKSVEGYRSYGNFYDDKKMKSDYDDYKTKISELEKKLNDYEDKWYSKFSKMETALAKLQSNSSAVTGLLGGS